MLARATLLIVSLALLAPAAGFADPPAHAPAHGYRSKHKGHDHHSHSGGFEVVFDSERGVYVAVGFPDVFYHEGRYYRHHEGGWQVSVRADGGWSVAAGASVPAAIGKAHKHHPGPAKPKHKK